ncbi:hypothetical protein PRZ48_008982 [Zasmidium cellare]|uniref:Uncharacterized protein n=1 Tax=Zasmidium cellare TaxID=395010 RepID=A0ABR0EI14_ZASCE|nr:hypothetical protein PRZ48_008982 [Zasmidium cellare]
MNRPPTYHHVVHHTRRPPSYSEHYDHQRPPDGEALARRISLPVEINHNRRTAEDLTSSVSVNTTTTFSTLQNHLRDTHLQNFPENLSFTWTTWLKYANDQRRHIRDDNWEGIRLEILSLGSARDPSGGDFPTSLITQASPMSEERWMGLSNDMVWDSRMWGVEGWEEYFLLRGYYFRDRPHEDEQDREEGQTPGENRRGRVEQKLRKRWQGLRSNLASIFRRRCPDPSDSVAVEQSAE